MDRSAKFWNRLARRYSRQPIADEATYQRKLEVTRGYLQPDMELLEFGCGTGSTALLHAPYVKHILATDIAPNMVEIARSKAAEEHVQNVTFECVSADALELADRSLDVVLGLNILHLLDNMDEVISRIYKALRPGGVFVTSTACVGDMTLIFRVIAPVGRFLRLFPLVKVFSSRELEDSFTRAGFVIEHAWKPGKNKAVFIVAKRMD